MNSKKRTGHKPITPSKERVVKPVAKRENKWLSRLMVLNPFWVCFLTIWFFATAIFGDVFHLAEQYSYFSFEGDLMKFLLEQHNGKLWYVGRLALLSFHFPLLGGAFFALLLTAIAQLTSYLFNSRGYLKMATFLAPFGYLAFLISRGYNLYFRGEPGMIFAWPLLLLSLLLIMALIRFLLAKESLNVNLLLSAEKSRFCLAQNGAILLLGAAVTAYAWFPHQNLRLTTRMQAQMWEQDWHGMIDTALKSKRPTRALAAYYAIALLQTDQINERLFEIRYHYEEMKAKDYDNRYDKGNYYVADCNFYAGLLYPAYHESMENLVISGPNTYILKRMAVTAMLTGENALARKYLAILDKKPFEGDFVKKTSALVGDPTAIDKVPEYNLVLSLTPVGNAFAQQFPKPLFIGYNLLLNQGRSLKALEASLATSLYTKMKKEFVMRTQPLEGKAVLPKAVSEGVTLFSNTEPVLAKRFPQNQLAESRFKQFLQASKPYINDKALGREKLAKQFKGYYPYYFYFENQPEDSQGYEEREKVGVN